MCITVVVIFTTVPDPVCHSEMDVSDTDLFSLEDYNAWIQLDPFDHPKPEPTRSLYLSDGDFDGHRWITTSIFLTIFQASPNVESLTLVHPDLTPSSELRLRSLEHAQRNLTSLSIEYAKSVDPEALLQLLCTLPKLDNLKLSGIRMGGVLNPGAIPPVAPEFKGKLTLLNTETDGERSAIAFLNTHLPMAFVEVHLDVDFTCTRYVQRVNDLFAACKKTVKRVGLFAVPVQVFGPEHIGFSQTVDLSPLEVLEEVKFGIADFEQPGHWVGEALDTITSRYLRKVTFKAEERSSDPTRITNLAPWNQLDSIVHTKLAGRLPRRADSMTLKKRVGMLLKPPDRVPQRANRPEVYFTFQGEPSGKVEPSFLELCREAGFDVKFKWRKS